jgi:hypothetical protein
MAGDEGCSGALGLRLVRLGGGLRLLEGRVLGGCGLWRSEALRHGHEDGEVTLGGRRVALKRPRARTPDGEREVALATYEHFADRDPLSRHVLEQMLAGVSTRRYGRALEPVGEEIARVADEVATAPAAR